jgi:hypothetical protein
MCSQTQIVFSENIFQILLFWTSQREFFSKTFVTLFHLHVYDEYSLQFPFMNKEFIAKGKLNINVSHQRHWF